LCRQSGSGVRALANFITDFGDTAVTIPLAAAMTILLPVVRRPRLALDWVACIAVCGGVITAAKLILAGCRHDIVISGVTSPSGHAALGSMVYGGFTLLLVPSFQPAGRRLLYAGTALLVAGIVVTRVILHAHTVAEAALGLAVGLASLAAFRALLAAAPPPRLPVVWLCGGALIVIALMHGTRWPTEFAIHGIARSGLFHALLPWCS